MGAAGVRYHGRGYRRTVALHLGVAVVVYLLVGRPFSSASAGQGVWRLAVCGVAEPPPRPRTSNSPHIPTASHEPDRRLAGWAHASTGDERVAPICALGIIT